ncbi:MAG: pyridine nucleotide-disulfide oxidoreductase [Marinilabiliales bacterium]|nr:MAG: pyridine nucleotide-disulfide oxidoreductase [Marinilabiliales bacterium]
MEEKRIGVYVCWCGTNIAMMVDVKDVSKEMEKLPGVVLAKNYKYMCSDPGQDMIIKDIKKYNLDRIVVAACSPRIHEITFRNALENAGLNPYMLQMANISEQDSWVHTDRIEATRKAKSLVAAAIRRVIHHKPLKKRIVNVHPNTLIIGGGVAGMSAALELSEAGKKSFLIEKSDQLGGTAAKLKLSFPYLNDVVNDISNLIKRVEKSEHIQVILNAEVQEIHGFIGNFNGIVKTTDEKEYSIEFGNTIVATGLKSFDAGKLKNYGYWKYSEVITSIEFELLVKQGVVVNKKGIVPENIAIIHCAGSRNENYNNYCSRTCCMSALKYANQLRNLLPDANIFEMYADMRTFGRGCEELYTSTSRKGIMFLMFDQRAELPLIKEDERGNGVVIEFKELLSGEEIQVPADLVILMVGMEAHENAKSVSHLSGISMDSNGFFIEKHPKLDPVATTTDGVYVVGSCQAPKDIPDSVSQAKAAVARILATILRGTVEVEVTTAEINADICCGCQFCISVCPYGANSFDAANDVSVVNEVLCKGCGTCATACPSGAISTKHFTDEQILSQIEGLMAKVHELEELETN